MFIFYFVPLALAAEHYSSAFLLILIPTAFLLGLASLLGFRGGAVADGVVLRVSRPSRLKILLGVLLLLYLTTRHAVISNLLGYAFFGNIIDAMRFFTAARYDQIGSLPWHYSVGTAAMFTILTFAPLAIVLERSFLVLIVIAFILLLELSATGRAGVVMATVSASFILLLSVRRQIERLGNLVFFSVASAILAFSVALMAALQFVRVSHRSDAWDIVVGKLPGYTVRPFGSLLEWYDSSSAPLTLGKTTFLGISKHLDRDMNVQGVYDQTVSVWGVSNIHTVLRGLIADYSLTGAILIAFLAAHFFSFFCAQRSLKLYILGAYPIYIFFGFPFVSIYSYTSIILGVLLVMTLCLTSLAMDANGPQRED